MQMADADAREFDLPADLAGLQTLSEGVERLAEARGWPSSTAFAVQLCLEEAVSNVIRHGGLPAGERVRVDVRQADGAIVVEIADRGVAFDPLAAPPPPPLTDLESATIGGRGIGLMHKFCPDIGYRRSDGRNFLRFAFPLPPDRPGA